MKGVHFVMCNKKLFLASYARLGNIEASRGVGYADLVGDKGKPRDDRARVSKDAVLAIMASGEHKEL